MSETYTPQHTVLWGKVSIVLRSYFLVGILRFLSFPYHSHTEVGIIIIIPTSTSRKLSSVLHAQSWAGTWALDCWTLNSQPPGYYLPIRHFRKEVCLVKENWVPVAAVLSWLYSRQWALWIKNSFCHSFSAFRKIMPILFPVIYFQSDMIKWWYKNPQGSWTKLLKNKEMIVFWPAAMSLITRSIHSLSLTHL